MTTLALRADHQVEDVIALVRDLHPVAEGTMSTSMGAALVNEIDRLAFALLNDPSDGTCRLCGGAPTDERKLCEPCFDELTAYRTGGPT